MSNQKRFALIGSGIGPIDKSDALADGDILVYNAATGKWVSQAFSGTAALTEAVQDIVGAMATDNTDINFTYDDGAGTLVAAVLEAAVTQHQAALEIAETQITEGALLARVAGNEAITGAWTFGTAAQTEFLGGTDLWIRDAGFLRIYDSTDTDYGQFSHDGTNLILAHVNTTALRIEDVNVVIPDGSLTLGANPHISQTSVGAAYLRVSADASNAYFGVSDAANQVINGDSAGMAVIFGDAGIGFSGDSGTTMHATISSTGRLVSYGVSAGGDSTFSLNAASTLPGLQLRETDAATDTKRWDFFANGGGLTFRLGDGEAESWCTVTRTAGEVNIVNFLGDEFQVDATLLDFNGEADFSSLVTLPVLAVSATTPEIQFIDAGGGADEKNWIFDVNAGSLRGYTEEEDGSNPAQWLDVSRTGSTVTEIDLTATTLDLNGNCDVSGTLTRATNTVWDAGNDGASSGLDADLLDGVQGSGYATYASGSFTATLTGMTAATTGTINYDIAGDTCTLWFRGTTGITGTSNTTSMTMTGLPAACQPAGAVSAPCGALVSNSTGNRAGLGQIAAGASTITFYVADASALWTSTGFAAANLKGVFEGWSMTYALT